MQIFTVHHRIFYFTVPLLVLLSTFSINAVANHSYATDPFAETDDENILEIKRKARIGKLYENPEWLKLLHYRKNSFTNTYFSEIDGSRFFNAKNGSSNSYQELMATIEAMHTTNVSEINQHPQCRFPARLSWLQKKLPDINEDLPHIKCDKFLVWRHFLNAESVSLVFNSPSVDKSRSTFGNTFLKINPPKLRSSAFKNNNNLLPAKAISYAIDATTQQHDELFYNVKALVGAYSGKFTIESFESRIARYNNNDVRDLWEYELTLTPFETEKLLNHVWELMQAEIHYFFLDENSAYLLLALIEAAKPGLDLTSEFALQVLPIDTLRLLVEKEIVSDIKYIPSPLTNILYHLDEYTSDQQDLVIDLINGNITTENPNFQKQSSTIKIFLLEIALQYLQVSFKRGDIDRIAYKVRTLKLSKARKKLNPKIQLPNSPPPSDRPDQGHKSSMLGVGVGYNDINNFLELHWRPALHGLLDSNGTYLSGMQINYLDTILRLDDNNGLLQIEQLHFVNLYSLLPRSTLFKPMSFKFKVGFDRERIFKSNSDSTYFNVNGGLGLTYQIFEPFHIYGLIEATSIFNRGLDNAFSLAIGPNLGVLWQVSQNWKVWFDSSTQFYDSQNNNNIIESLQLNQSYLLSKNKVLFLNLSNKGVRNHTYNEGKLSIAWYY